MKSLIKKAALVLVSIIAVVYLTLTSFFWWNENAIEALPHDIESVYARSQEAHELLLIDDGLASLAKRIELIEAAKRGVEVKLLVDFSSLVLKLKPIYAKVLAEKNVQVRYYNTVQALRFVSSQHRSHRKFLIVDGEYALTGGRNIGNDYFNLSSDYNFLDSDILIHGPIVKEIRKNFYTYWNSKFSSPPNPTEQKPADSIVKNFIEPNSKVYKALTEIEKLREEIAGKNFKSACHDITFIADSPGIMLSNRLVFSRLQEFLMTAKSELVGETPYFILKADGINLLKRLSARGVQQTILTNSLYSTDAFYTISATAPSLDDIRDAGVNLHVYDGRLPKSGSQLSQGYSVRWGIHAKRAVVDKKHVLIGTYNADPRSANLNSEVLIICRDNPELARQMLKSIDERLDQSRRLFAPDVYALGSLVEQATFRQKALFVLALPLANLFDFLL